jgi:catechol 2,3-dioxygenase-like lactoylglutathione lyase family enzyme
MNDPKRAGVTAIHSINRFVFSVPDLGIAKDYFTSFGLDVREQDGHLDLYTFGHPHRWGSIYQGQGAKQLAYLSFGLYEEDWLPMLAHLDHCGIERIAPHPLADDGGVWIKDPDGTPLQLIVAGKSSPNEKSASAGPQFTTTVRGTTVAPGRSSVKRVHPLRLTHLLLYTTDVLRSVRFYSDVLGTRLSDHSGEGIAFVHGAHSSDHHLVAFAKSDGPGLHHTSWTVNGVDEVGLGMQQMQESGHKHGWGVGRHVLGSNYFYYVQDPWGSFTEYSYDIDFIGVETDWPAFDHPGADSFYLWGPAVPADFITNHESAARAADAQATDGAAIRSS